MELKFNNGKFRIMQIADTQDTSWTSPDTVNFIRCALKKAKPDLVVFSGDQLKGYGITFNLGDRKANPKIAIDNLLKPLDEMGMPFTFVFGNHDDQCAADKKQQLELYKQHKNCLSFNADDNIDGYCNHNLLVMGEDGNPKLNVLLIDSLSMSLNGRCSPVSEGQIEWYKGLRDELKEKNGDYVPTIMFQHIPVPEIWNLLMEVPKKKGVATGYRNHAGKFFDLNPECCVINDRSFVWETPATPEVNTGEFDALNEKGDVFAMFFGHDHNNSFMGEYKGMKMGYTQGCGFNVYGPADKRGVRIFDFDENDVKNFETTTIEIKDLPDFKVEKKIRYNAYTYAPNSFDAAMPLIKGAVAGIVATVGLLTARKIIKRKK